MFLTIIGSILITALAIGWFICGIHSVIDDWYFGNHDGAAFKGFGNIILGGYMFLKLLFTGLGVFPWF